MNTKEAVEIMSEVMSEADARIVLKIVKKAIEVMKLEPDKSDEEYAALSPEERYKELITPRFCSFKFTEEVECIFIRFVGYETPLANVLFFPIEATKSFLDTAREYYNTPGTTLTHEEIEKFAFNKSVDMFLIMMRNLYPRVLATMSSITDETINEWFRQENESYREYCSRQGIIVPSNEYYKPLLKKAGLSEKIRLYDLRHTCATLLLAEGENPKVVSERLGHATIVLTLDTYSHVLPSMQQSATDKLEGILFNKKAAK